MAKILLPINLDRRTSAIASLLREIALGNPAFEFYSFSNPPEGEDKFAEELWAIPNLHKTTPIAAALTRFDLVHTASATKKNLLAMKLAKVRSFGQAKFLFTANLQIDENDGPYLQFVEALKRADAIVSVSEIVKVDVTKRFSANVEEVIPNGFDPDFMDPRKAEPSGNPIALWVGTVEPRKRPDLFRRVAERLPDRQFVMAGPISKSLPDEEREGLEALANVRMLGAITREELRDRFADAAMLVFPSGREGLPLSVIEALGMGVPVLGQPATSMPELIEQGVNGFLHDPEDLDAWAGVLEAEFQTSASDRQVRAVRLRKSACEQYAWRGIADRYGNLYRELLSGR